jgi:NADH-quinone oxidoreductase subunit E
VSLFERLRPEFDALRARYPHGFDASLVLPCLHRIQAERGYISDEDVAPLAGYLGVPAVQVEEVLAFYSQFRRQPVGRWHLQFCRNIACSMRGAERLIDQAGRKLGVRPGETTADGRCTLGTVECLGSCGTAPMMMVNGRYVENLSPGMLDRLLGDLE